MSEPIDLDALARKLIDDNFYLTLGTADGAGRPWVSPVYFAADGYRDFYWISQPEAEHSKHVVARPEVSLVVYDSRVPLGGATAVYVAATAVEVPDDQVGRGIDVYSARSVAHGGRVWTADMVAPAAGRRLYRATAEEQWLIGPPPAPEERTAVRPWV